MTRILVENLNGLDLGGITTHIFNYISVLQRSSDYKIDIVVTVQENNDVIDKFKSLGVESFICHIGRSNYFVI